MIYIVLAFLAVFFIVIFVRSIPEKKPATAEPMSTIPEIGQGPAKKLSRAVRFKTVSYADSSRIDKKEFQRFHDFCKKAYPLAHKKLSRKQFNEFAVLYTWEGANSDLKPVMLCSHFDVVPAEDDSNWKQKPFSGAISDNYVWGRGTQDVKISLIAIFEAVEMLIKDGFRPTRSIYLAFGGDEEISGNSGAVVIADYLEKKKVDLEFILDEGGIISEEIHKSIKRPIAHISLAEKGNVNVVISSKSSDGGHASMPGRHTATTELCRAITKLDKHPFSPRLIDPFRSFLKHISSYSSWWERVIFSNLWLFSPLVKLLMARRPDFNAHIRTTMAVTMLQGSDKENVLSPSATANINVRILPGDSVDFVLKRISKIVKSPGITVTMLDRGMANNPVTGSRQDSHGFSAISRTLSEVIPEAIIAPTLLCASTDSKKYSRLTRDIFRFTPVRATLDDLKAIHGENERISMENTKLITSFYYRLIINSCT